MTLYVLPSCAWCGHGFEPNGSGRPRRYCSLRCRRDAGHYREAAPRWRAELAELEASGHGYRQGPPTFLRNRMAALRDLLGRGER